MDNRRNMFFYYHKDGETDDKVETLQKLAIENGFTIVDNHKDANIIVSIGGDGAFLQAVRKTGFRQDCLYTGITREGQSGLYCDFNIDNFDQMLHSLQHDELEVRRFPIIKAQINDGNSFYCLNEVTIRSTIVKTIVMDVEIDGTHFETFRGDGLIVATPTGSTGYTKSARGAVIDPLTACFQISEVASLNNNQYRTLGSSFILNKGRHLKLKVLQEGNDYPIISLDNEAHSIRQIDNIQVTMDDCVIKTVKLKNNSYWDRVKRTFL
ncbi:NAD kinase [Oceanobacillus polygoni]|uniref:NAD kinase n=1 Tax=Oceanobacillus polygoni TaxID=1235259 RepID=A0A9X0YUM3_9BACI|nr:NAD kinase [Oceanobacillus polygoni]MBP2077326.1 NAD+ kinase [Oceanobacillus polygoni]